MTRSPRPAGSVIEYEPNHPVVAVAHLDPQPVEHTGSGPCVTTSAQHPAVQCDNGGRVVVLSARHDPVQQCAQHQPVIDAATMTDQRVTGFSYREQTFERRIDGVERLR